VTFIMKKKRQKPKRGCTNPGHVPPAIGPAVPGAAEYMEILYEGITSAREKQGLPENKKLVSQIAWTSFKRVYKKSDGKWIKRKKTISFSKTYGKKRRNPGARLAAAAAVKAYKKFHWGDAVDEEIKSEINVPDVLFAIGELVTVEYDTHKEGEQAIWKHTFKKGSRPFLASDADGKQLFIVGGKYAVKKEGITD